MLFEMFDSFLGGLADFIEVGPIGMLTSPMPSIEADVRRIAGCSVREAFAPAHFSSSNDDGKEEDDKMKTFAGGDKGNERSPVKEENLGNDVKIGNTSMGNDIEKFKKLIESINATFPTKSGGVNLGLIYDRCQLNDYGKVILDRIGEDSYQSVADLSIEERVKLALSFKEKCQEGICDKCAFIFWSLMLLTVDKTDQEERLSLICDYSRFLEISEEEMMNIIGLIRKATKMNV